MILLPKRIALHGYGRAGKDEAGRILAKYGYTRKCFGDIIKTQLDPLIQKYFGFSAFTDDPVQKEKIRPILVHWGYCNEDAIEREYFADLPEICVNTRIFRVAECVLWRKCGGVIWEITRPGCGPKEPKEAEELEAARGLGLINLTIANDGSLLDLENKILAENY